MEAPHTGNPVNDLEVKRSKVTGSQSIKSLLLLLAMYTQYAYMRREDIGTATLISHAVPAWLFLYTPSY